MTAITTVQGDITRLDVDVIVNAANSRLMPGGGVDGAIHAAGGRSIYEECQAIRAERGPLGTGEAVITTAGRLPAKHVIHTVGPVWGEVEEEEAVGLLSLCYRNSLDLAIENGAQTIAFPNISTGVYGFPKDLAARTAVAEVKGWIADNPEAMAWVSFVCYDSKNFEIYEGLLGL